jgi:transcriptional regulator with XRE-family HTH domain
MSKRALAPAQWDVHEALPHIGKMLRRARLARGDTQKVAGERLQLHPQTIARIEQGDPGVAFGAVLSVMAHYGMRDRVWALTHDDETTAALLRSLLPSRGRPERSASTQKRGRVPEGVEVEASDEELVARMFRQQR